MALKPWHKVVEPREDLREGRPLDAAEFAVHLDQVRDGRAPEDYQDPERFFDRTYPTKNLTKFAAEAVRRLSGEKTEASAVFNLSTQFGGGKTHALTLLYHLAKHGDEARKWRGVREIFDAACIKKAEKAAVAVFVGTEFDSIIGRGGDDGTPLRKTPWGEIAWQLGGKKALDVVAEHEKQKVAPAGDVIRKFLPKDKPALILLDELMNYVSRSRKSGLGTQLYNFLHNLSEEARGQSNVVLAVSIPASELEMSADDQSDYERIKKLLDRVGKPVLLAAEEETSEIIRRRLFDWMGLPADGKETAAEYAHWVRDHRKQLPGWFPLDQAVETFTATYPFHPTVLSVFERKWQGLPRFQQTRGILRLLALWVSHAYQEGYKGARKDPLITMGTAPLEDPMFRTAVFEQLGQDRLESAVTTDICGKKDAHATRLDQEAVDTIKKAKLHRRVATSIFFESNGGQNQGHATAPEIRLAVSEPDLDIANVETVLEALVPPDGACYYLDTSHNRYWFSTKPNLNKLLADKRANVDSKNIDEIIRQEIQKVFAKGSGVERVFFPEQSSQIPDRPAVTFVVLPPEQAMSDRNKTLQQADKMTREYGTSSRTFKSALIWCVPEDAAPIREEARKLLAWEAIDDDKEGLRLDEVQQRQLGENLKKARRDITECVWRIYKNLVLLGKDNKLRHVDLGLVNSSQSDSMVALILARLRQDGDIEKDISPSYLVRHWPGAFTEWSTKAVRDAFFASPLFPRLLSPDSVKETIARGVGGGMIAYVGKDPDGRYKPFRFEQELSPLEVEISEDMFIIKAEEAKKHIEPPKLTTLSLSPDGQQVEPGKRQTFTVKGYDQHGRDFPLAGVDWEATGGTMDEQGVFLAAEDEGNYVVTARSGDIGSQASITVSKSGQPPPPPPPPKEHRSFAWSGPINPQKWTQFYMKVLTKFAADSNVDLKLNVSMEVTAKEGQELSEQKIDETKTALRELGMDKS